MERRDEELGTIEELKRLVGLLPEDFRPTILGFMRRVAIQAVQENTNIEVVDNQPKVLPIRRIGPNMVDSYREMYSEILRSRQLYVHRFRHNRRFQARP